MSEYIVQVNGFTYTVKADNMCDAMRQFANINPHPFATQILITKRV